MATAFNEDAYQARVNQIPGYDSPYGNKPSAPTPMASAAPSTAPAQTPRAQFVADQNAKLAAANAKLAERTQEMNARHQPAMSSPTNTFPGNRLQVESGAASAPPAASGAAPAQPSRGAAGFLADAFPGTTAAIQGSMDDAKEAYRQGGFGAALGQSARVAATPLIGLADDVYSSAAKVVRPVTDTALQAGNTFLTGDASSIAPAQQGAAAGPVTPPPAATPQTQSLVNAEEMQQRQAKQVPGLSGVYKHGEGQYSDNAQDMGLPQNLGQPSAQNMQAANNLAGQEQKRSMMSVMREQQEQQQMQQPRGFASPQIDHSGNSSTSKDELRRLRWAAESAMENAPRKKYAMQHPAVMAYQAALQGDTAARYGGQAGLEAKTNDTNAGLVREQMQQQGANQRERPRTMMDAKRLSMDQQTQGFANRAAAQQEQLRNTVLDEQATPEQRNTAQRNLAALAGRTGTENLSNNFMRRRTGEQQEDIVDLRTGGVLGAPQLPPNMTRQVGTSGGKPVYEDANGKLHS